MRIRGTSLRAFVALAGAFLALAQARAALALCGDGQLQLPGEQCDVTAQAGDYLCPGACIPPGVNGACSCARVPTDAKQYAAIANDRLRIGTGSSVLFGGVIATQARSAATIGRRTFMPSASVAVADRARVAGEAQLGRLFANTAAVSPSAVIANGGPFLFTPPITITGLQPFPSIAPGTIDVAVPEGATLGLSPGAYGAVIVGQHATLILNGYTGGSGAGTFQLRSLRVDGDGRVLANNPVILNVAGRLGIGGGGILGPSASAPLIGGDIQVNVAGRSARLKQGATMTAHLTVPNGGVSLGRGASLTGLVVGDTISAAGTALITRQGSCGDGLLEAGEPCDTSAAGGDAACPGRCIPGDPDALGRIALGQHGQCTCRCTTNADCDDHNACNGTETCDAGVCTRTLPPSCDDGNPCTRDCDPAVGCVSTPVTNGTLCSDGNACTTPDTCQGGTCTAGPARNCEDGNSCTADTCDPATGCHHAALPNGTACSDNNACTLSDACVSGTCVGGPSANCFDNDPCTDDTCDPAAGCTHPPVLGGVSCDDGNACTAPDTCQTGVCGGPPASCNDADPCTADSCDAKAGCQHATLPNGTPCAPGRNCVNGSCL